MFRNPAIDAIVILVIVLLIMGPKRLPGLGKGLGQGMREFKDGITGDQKDAKPEINEATPAGQATTQERPAEPAAASRPAQDSSEQRS
ncbi:MAG: twin-arginine translocase TatA/TatE family subunit [Solirubrobacterales bacterium]|nr:twin-arginine translocase TatA/TatE family subunit [Solirubrobacterales bacterium]